MSHEHVEAVKSRSYQPNWPLESRRYRRHGIKNQKRRFSDSKSVSRSKQVEHSGTNKGAEDKSEMKQLIDKMTARLFTRFPALLTRWARRARILSFSATPWTPFSRSIDKSRLALVTTGGVHLKSQAPFDMSDSLGDPSFREIPSGADPAALVITHNYFDHRDADKDIGILFPVEGVMLLERFGEIGRVNHRHFSFMGHIRGRKIESLLKTSAPEVAASLRRDKVDIVLLTPA